MKITSFIHRPPAVQRQARRSGRASGHLFFFSRRRRHTRYWRDWSSDVCSSELGESLGVRLAREGAWPVDRSVRVLRDVADALAYAHARGVVHRDIKPDNILIDRASGRPMVTDFGIARAAAGETRLTLTGVAVGTPAYMSPEQAVGEREVDGRSDLYSLGVVAYHMLVGEPPFKAGNTPGMLMKHVAERPRPL